MALLLTIIIPQVQQTTLVELVVIAVVLHLLLEELAVCVTVSS